MSHSALVSLILPAYKSSWFEEALQCALTQDYDNVEIIITDDCPTHDIERIVERYKSNSRFPITYIRNLPALGEILNVEKGISLAKGKYVKFLYDDDTLEPECISLLVEAMENYPSARLATSRRHRIDVMGKVLSDMHATASPVTKDTLLLGRDVVSYQLNNIVNFIGEPSTVLMYLEDLQNILAQKEGLFSLDGEIMYFLGDLTLYTKILQKGDLVYLVRPLSSLRISRQQASQSGRDNDSRAAKSHKLFPELLVKLGMGDKDALPAGHIRIATREKQNEWMLHNVTSEIEQSYKESLVADWIRQRTLLPSQQQRLEQHSSAFQAANLTVVIYGDEGVRTRVDKTLASLEKTSWPGLNIQTVVVSDMAFSHVNTASGSSSVQTILSELARKDPQGWFLTFQAGGEFFASGLLALSTTLAQANALKAIYGDEVFCIDGKAIGAKFKPDFNLDLFLSQPSSLARNWFLRGEAINEFGLDASFGSASEFDLLINIIERDGFSTLGHLAEPLFISMGESYSPEQEQRVLLRHLRHRGYENARITVDVYGHYHINYGHVDTPLVSIIIPTGENIASLVTCVTSVIEKTEWVNYELLVAADAKAPEDVYNWLKGLAEIDPARIKVLIDEGVTTRAATLNTAISNARGQFISLLDPDLVVTQPGWLTALLNHGQRPEVGIVGGKQLYSDQKVRHAGYLLGVNGVAGEAFYRADADAKGYMGRLHSDQNYSAVSGEFMLLDRRVIESLGGLDETVDRLWDIDLCLRAREQGWFTVWTPSATILRSVSPQKTLTEEEVAARQTLREQSEETIFKRWMPIVCNDPANNPNLSLNSEQFIVCPDSQLSWRPMSWNNLPVVLPHMGDLFGCGYYRVIKPFEAMIEHGKVDGKLSSTLLSIPSLARYKPDSIIIQRNFSSEFHEWIRAVKSVCDPFTVFELDDYLPNIPIKNHHRSDFKSDTLKHLRKSLNYMDKFVVSTEPLADAFSQFHSNIVVMPNRVSADWWGGLNSLRGQGKKVRVGWAGGSSHTGDLELVADVIKAFADEVEWVFLGMCPDKLKPYIHEYHHGVDIEVYPRKLASLNLDLAIAPVEDNFFNTCKSNLRILEYGACAIPVICSDVDCYRTINEVTRVRNRFKDWVDAIRFHLDHSGQSERMGQELQAVVFREWMHNADSAAIWAKAWLPD